MIGMRKHVSVLATLLLLSVQVVAEPQMPVYKFGVAPAFNAITTARYWNPILEYVSHRSGVKLDLVVTRTGTESTEMAARGEFDFVYSNHIFKPKVREQKYQVILRTPEKMHGQIVVLSSSPIRTLADLEGKRVGFPSKASFVCYSVNYDTLVRLGIHVERTFGGNQEGIMEQLRAGHVDAAGVLDRYLRDWAGRTGVGYRVIWESEPYADLPIAHHPRVPEHVWREVQKAFSAMQEDHRGQRILADSAAIVLQEKPLEFVVSSDEDYQPYLEFYATTKVRDIH